MTIRKRNRSSAWVAVLTVMGVVSAGASASAAVLTFTDQAEWEAALAGAASLEDFEGATDDVDFTFTPTASPNGDLTLSAFESETFSNNMLIEYTPNGTYSGSDFNSTLAHVSLRYFHKANAESVTIAFPAGVSAFALDYNAYDNQGDSVDLSFAGTNGAAVTTFSPSVTSSPSSPVVGFFGVVDTGAGASIDSFTISANASLGDGSSIFMSFDNIRYGAAIPEPTAAVLLALAGLSAGALRRAR